MSDRIDAGKKPKLTLRQEQCLRGALELKSAKEVARDLGITSHAVEKHFRIAREKFGVATTAEAARLYAASLTGRESPHSGPSDLKSLSIAGDDRAAEGGSGWVPGRRFGETTGAQSLDQPISPRQTLLAIAAVSFGSIIALLILVACAEAIRSLVGR
jgi:DNA-binding CsgD family transcriptional regulator